MRLSRDFLAEWDEVVRSAETSAPLSAPAQELLEELISLGYVHPTESVGEAWRASQLEHVPRPG